MNDFGLFCLFPLGLPCLNENEAGESHSGLHGSPHVISLRPQNDNFCGIILAICVQIY